MKCFKEDFNELFKRLPIWNALSPSTRLFFVTQIGSNLKCTTDERYHAEITELRTAGLMQKTSPFLEATFRPLRRWLRAMHRHPVFSEPSIRPQTYLQDHLTETEAKLLLGIGRYPYITWQRVIDAVTDPQWVNNYRQAPSFKKWEEKLIQTHDERWIESEPVGLALKHVIERCITEENPLDLNKLIADADMPLPHLAKALSAGTRYAFLYASLEPNALDPVIGLWPPLRERLAQPPPALPEWHAKPPAGSVPVGMDLLLDMTTILVHASPDGLRAVQGRGLAKAQYQRLAPAIGASIGTRGVDEKTVARINTAVRWCEDCGLLKYRDKRSAKALPRHYAATPKSDAWLAKPYAARWKEIADALRHAYDNRRKDRYAYHDRGLVYAHTPYFGMGYVTRDLDMEQSLVKTFDEVPVEKWWPAEILLVWCARSANPLLTQAADALFSSYYITATEEREWRWKQTVESFIDDRLLPLSGLRAVLAPDGSRWLSVTEAGRYLLRQTDRFQPPTEDLSGGVLIQPNFDIVFTAPAPHLEAECARVAERIGHGVGTLFRFTRPSVLKALESDVDVGAVLETIASAASKKTPANVNAQIRDWIKSYRKVSICKTVLIRCPDIETAQSVQALFPRLVKPLTKTILELTNAKSISDITKRLKKNGVGVDRGRIDDPDT